MRRTTRYTALVVVGMIGLGVVGLAPSASAAAPDGHATTGGFRPGTIAWQPCQDAPSDPEFRCATLQLPIDWAHPDGPTFGLAIAERLASDPTTDRGPLLINFGGPGVSGVDFTLQADTYFSADLLKHFDVIGFDPRGTNRSDAVVCSEDLLSNRPSLVPVSPAEFDTLVTFNKKLAADCRAHTGAIFDHVDSASVSRDMDAIRAALGVHQISYYGLSYGTLLGQTYAELFPDRVRAMVIDSNEDHSMDTQQFLLTEAAASEDSFDQFVAWCDRDTTCALHGQNVFGIWDNLLREADNGTLTVPGPQVRPTWLQLVGVAFGDLYGPDWSSLAQLIAQLNSGTPAADLTAAFAPHTNRDTTADGLGHFPLTTLCEDWSLPVRDYQQLRQYYAETTAIAPHMRVGANDWGATFFCLDNGDPVNDPQHRLQVRTDVPLLVLNAVHDPVTPYVAAVDDAVQLGEHGRLVTYLGWGHGAYPHSACTIATIDSYLIDRTLPKPGATCAAVPPPDNQHDPVHP